MNRRLTRIDELKRDIPPAHDLWPAIAAAIEADKAQQAAPLETRRRAGWWPAVGLAASVALVAIGVLIGQGIAPPAAPPVVVNTPAAGAPVLTRAELRDVEYQKQRSQLLVEVQTKLQAMPQAERDKVAGSLATLRRSIDEINAALGKDPANALLQELFVSSCQEEMRALTAVRDSGDQEI